MVKWLNQSGDPIQTIRAVDQAADRIRASILDGAHPAGSRLPPERVLAEALGISRLTLRAALARLEAEGLVQPRQGSGVLVLDYREHGGVGLLIHLLERGDLRLFEPFLRLRRVLAAEALALATERITPDELEELANWADQLAQILDPGELMAGNLDFSRRILQLADNLPMALLFNTVTQVVRGRPEVQALMLSDPTAVRASFPAIVALLRGGDPERARAVVQGMLATIDRASLDTLESP